MKAIIRFGNRLREIIADSGESLKNVSEKSGVGLSRLRHWLSPKCEMLPSTKNLIKLADYFGCSIAFILGTEEENSLPNPNKNLPDFGTRLNELLSKRLLKLYLIKKEGYLNASSSFYNWTKRKTMPNVFNLIRLAEALDCSVDFLIGREN